MASGSCSGKLHGCSCIEQPYALHYAGLPRVRKANGSVHRRSQRWSTARGWRLGWRCPSRRGPSSRAYKSRNGGPKGRSRAARPRSCCARVTTLTPFLRCRRASPIRLLDASPPRHRRARRVLAMAWWAREGAVRPARRPRRAFFAYSTTSPNWPATPREWTFGCSRPTRRPCAILVGPAPCPSRRAPPPATRLAPRVRFVVFLIPGIEFRC